MVATYRAIGTSAIEKFLQEKMANIVEMLEGALTIDNVKDKAIVG